MSGAAQGRRPFLLCASRSCYFSRGGSHNSIRLPSGIHNPGETSVVVMLTLGKRLEQPPSRSCNRLDS